MHTSLCHRMKLVFEVYFLYLAMLMVRVSGTPPHIIIILADDLGWDDVSFHGSQQIPTPNIDALAYSGPILNNYYVQPICTPTRSALLTARHPIHTGLQDGVIVGTAPYGLGLNETLLPQYLKTLGYASHAVGKWHLGFFAKEYTPTHRGFDSHYGYWQGAADYYDHTYITDNPYDPSMRIVGVDFHSGMETVRDDAGHYSTHVFTTKAQRIIENHDPAQPLFLYIAHQAVHSSDGGRAPLQAPEKYIEMFSHIADKNRRVYAAMTAILDESVGNVTKSLHDRGLLENSIIIFSTDNGGPAAGHNANWACNAPLRGMKGSIWEGGTRGAGFIWSPKLKSAGSVSNQLMQVTDWLPTLLTAVGFNTSSLPDNLDGMDMWATLNDNTAESPRKEMLYNINPNDGSYALRMGSYKLIHELQTPDWYPLPTLPLHTEGNFKQPAYSSVHNMQQDQFKHERAPQYMFKSDLTSILSSLGLPDTEMRAPVVIQCGPRPANASSNCQPQVAPCLFDLASDPCEFNNIAGWNSNIVQQINDRLEVYRASGVTPRNAPPDPKGLPIYHNNAWEVWVDL